MQKIFVCSFRGVSVRVLAEKAPNIWGVQLHMELDSFEVGTHMVAAVGDPLADIFDWVIDDLVWV